jgi:WhiB family redox-sensing transcriptional regulator
MITANTHALQAVADVSHLAWMDRALCREVGAEAFFIDGSGHHNDVMRAKAVCAGCPVVAPCLEYALAYEGRMDTFGRWGVFGGASPDERGVIARSRKQAAA